MHYHLILTEKCNLQCKYCYGKSMDEENDLNQKFKFCFNSPLKTSVKTCDLKKFLAKDKNSYLIFYGGEPLLEIPKITELMDSIDVPYRMQTNGLLLHKVPKEYMNRIGKILVSVDGNKQRTDFNRGKGVFDRVIKNINLIRENGYKGEILARMTISPEFPDIYGQVLFLLDSGFDSIHWQLDAEFYKCDFNFDKFSEFVKEYNSYVSRLADYWLEEIKKGRVIKIYPFLGIIDSLLKNEKTKLRCGAGYSGYAIDTKGDVVACPIMNGIEDFRAGTIKDSPDDLKKFEISGKCSKCKDLDLCGGRCLYSNRTELWPIEGQELVCITIRHLINEMKKILPEVSSLIDKGVVKKGDFEYEKYFGPEIIP